MCACTFVYEWLYMCVHLYVYECVFALMCGLCAVCTMCSCVWLVCVYVLCVCVYFVLCSRRYYFFAVKELYERPKYIILFTFRERCITLLIRSCSLLMDILCRPGASGTAKSRAFVMKGSVSQTSLVHVWMSRPSGSIILMCINSHSAVLRNTKYKIQMEFYFQVKLYSVFWLLSSNHNGTRFSFRLLMLFLLSVKHYIDLYKWCIWFYGLSLSQPHQYTKKTFIILLLL